MHRGPSPDRNWIDHHSITLAADLTADFHVFAAEWRDNEIRWFVDGIHFHTVTPPHPKDGEHAARDVLCSDGRQLCSYWPFDHGHPFFLLLNLAIGGWFDAPYAVDDTAFPADLQVRYVRVYQKAPARG